MNGDVDLFGDPVDAPIVEAPVESYGVRLTARQRALSDAGLNPLTGTRGPEGETCGGCVHRVLVAWHDKRFPKCDAGKMTHGSKTDVRAYWPACPKFERRTS